MIHYHGTPIGGKVSDRAGFFAGKHCLVSYLRQDDIGPVTDLCQSFVLDNGAFSIWRKGGKLDIDGYIKWVYEWHKHPGFDWALIPDVIGGSEEDNDALLAKWPDDLRGCPVWHMHESLTRLLCLCLEYPFVAIGSSGKWPTPGAINWWERMGDAMDFICDENGRPPCRLHGLRMLNSAVFTKLPLSSADSANVAINSGGAETLWNVCAPQQGTKSRRNSGKDRDV